MSNNSFSPKIVLFMRRVEKI